MSTTSSNRARTEAGEAHNAYIEERAGALWVVFDRANKLNALTPKMAAVLREAVERARAERPAALVLTGTGSAFTVGGDLEWFLGEDPAASQQRMSQAFRDAAELLMDLESLPIPVIAAVNGYCAAGGMEFVCFSDIVVAASSAQIGDGHANYGLLPVAGTVQRLIARVGKSNALRLLLTGEFISAREAADIGLVNWVVPDEELASFVESLCETLSRKAPVVLERMKHLANVTGTMSPEAASAAELHVALNHASSDVVQEGLAAFAQRRPPIFRS